MLMRRVETTPKPFHAVSVVFCATGFRMRRATVGLLASSREVGFFRSDWHVVVLIDGPVAAAAASRSSVSVSPSFLVCDAVSTSETETASPP